MAAGPTQRVGESPRRPFHLPSFLIQNLSREDPNVENLHLFSTEQYSFSKTDRVLQSLLIICISIAVIAYARADPLPSPNHITSRIPRQSVQSSAIAKVGYSKRRHILEIEFVNGQFTAISTFRFRCIAT
jgi:hypothetical protein